MWIELRKGGGMTEEQRKYILSFKEEDPLLMAFSEGQKFERGKVLEELEKLLCAHHKYVGSYRVITGTNEEIYDELFDAMQELRKGGESG